MKVGKVLLFILIDLFISTVVYLTNSYESISLSGLSWISFGISIYIAFSLLPLKKGNGISLAFLSIYCIVIFGRAFLQYGAEYFPTSLYFDSFSAFLNRDISKALILGIYSLMGLHIGILIKQLKGYKKTIYEKGHSNELVSDYIEIQALKKTGLIIFLISFFPAILNYYNMFSGIETSGDANTLLGMVTGLMLPFFIILIATNRKKWTFIVSVLYYFPQLLWGGRGRPILQLAIILFIYFKYSNKKKIRVKEKVIFLIGVILILNLFVVIKEYRGQNLLSWIGRFPSIYLQTFRNSNPLLEIIFEMGVALAPTAAAIQLVPNTIPIQYGKTIIYSLSTAIPDFFGIRPSFMSTYGNVPNLISKFAGASFGGSILQDFFVNFMWCTPFLMIVVGYLIQSYSHKIVNENSLSKTVFYSIILYPILWWPRSSLGFIFRYSFVTLFIPMVVYYFFRYYKIKYRSV